MQRKAAHQRLCKACRWRKHCERLALREGISTVLKKASVPWISCWCWPLSFPAFQSVSPPPDWALPGHSCLCPVHHSDNSLWVTAAQWWGDRKKEWQRNTCQGSVKWRGEERKKKPFKIYSRLSICFSKILEKISLDAVLCSREVDPLRSPPTFPILWFSGEEWIFILYSWATLL